MSDSPIYPGPRVPLLGRDGGVALAWQQFFRSLAQQAGGVDLSDEIEAIARKLGSPDGSISGIPAQQATATVIGVGGVQSAGTLADGRVTLSLRALEDSGSGELVAIERDTFGRVSGTRQVLPSDIPSPLWTFLVDSAGNYLTDADGALLRAPGVDLSQLGAGTTNSETVLRGDGAWTGGIQSDGGAGNFSWNVRGYGRPPGLQLDRAQGTPSAPTAVTSGLVIGTQIYRGWDGSAFSNGAQIRGLATENWTPTSRGSRLDFQTVAIGATTQILRAELDSDNFRPAANLGIGLGSAARNWNGVYSNAFYSGASQVVGARRTGWAAATGTATRTTFDTTTVTTAQLAERFKALLDDLIAHGLIGA